MTSNKKIKLHLGCGKRFLKDFIHIDIDYHDHIDYQQDIKSLKIFDDNTVDLIYSCGTFEYFDEFEAPIILKEWNRVLKPQGSIKLSVPDFDSIIKVYHSNGNNIKGEGILGPLFGRIDITVDNENKIMFHKTVYNYQSLSNLLISSNFENISKYDTFDFLPDDFDDYSKAFYPYKDKKGIQMHLNIDGNKKNL
tara:strand:- start:66 stop:647 length:582 start_codon:yes stop_codon:yes gene_type:complete